VLPEAHERLGPEGNEQLITVRRNALRLLKLVNTLLDFSRIEAGRVQAVYEATDLGGVTAEIASVFRSAMENAGLQFSVECPPIGEPVYVDRDMWEKVVSNLLSNAFKFTFDGSVAVMLKAIDGAVQLQVRDTGVGIPEEHRERVFERFHRIEGTQARTFEGTGIGLAFVQELVRLHGGEVRVESVLGRGSTFTVTIPLGTTHLPRERIQATRPVASTGVAADAYAQEAQGWLADEWGPIDLTLPKSASVVPCRRRCRGQNRSPAAN
jgi:signal transduction histidine kinase